LALHPIGKFLREIQNHDGSSLTQCARAICFIVLVYWRRPGHAPARVTPTYFHTNRAQAGNLPRTMLPAELKVGILEVEIPKQ
jgi:hypothetical protein